MFKRQPLHDIRAVSKAYEQYTSPFSTLLTLCIAMQKQYPERLGQLFIYEAPTVFWALWNCIWPFLTAATRDKVQLVSGDAGLKTIHSMVPADILPGTLGGSSPLKPFADAVKSLGIGEGVKPMYPPRVPAPRPNCKQLAATHARHSSIADSAHSDTTDL